MAYEFVRQPSATMQYPIASTGSSTLKLTGINATINDPQTIGNGIKQFLGIAGLQSSIYIEDGLRTITEEVEES